MQLCMQPRTCVSAGDISLLIYGVLGSTTIRAWGSLNHLAMTLGAGLPQALSPRNMHRVGGTRDYITKHFLDSFQQGRYCRDGETEAWEAAPNLAPLCSYSFQQQLGEVGSPVPISQIGKLKLRKSRSQNFKITENGGEDAAWGCSTY